MKVQRICGAIAAAITLMFYFACIGHAADLFAPIEDWQITQRENSDTREMLCVARTRASDHTPLIFDFSVIMNHAGAISFEIVTPQVPSWKNYGPEEPRAREVPPLQPSGLFWFDSGSKMPMIESFESARRCTIITPQTSYGLGSKLRVASHLHIKGEFSGDNSVYYLPNMNDTMQELEICHGKLTSGGTYAPAFVATLGQASRTLFEPIKTRLEKSAAVMARQREGGGDWRSELLLAGEAAADALRLQDAYTALSPAIAAASRVGINSAEMQRALARLIEVLILLERLDEAKAVARLHPQQQRFLGAIAKAEGNWDESRELFSNVVQGVTGKRIGHDEVRELQTSKVVQDLFAQAPTGYIELVSHRPRKLEAKAANRQAAEMRDILFLWGLGSLGQEIYGIDETCLRREADPFLSGPAFFGVQALGWSDTAMLHRKDGNDADHRRALGMAAYMRGVEMQHGGCLQMAKIDMTYALYEMKDGSGADGWAMLAELALLRQMDAVGQTVAAQNGAAAFKERIENQVGKASLPWLETSAFLLELAIRAGNLQLFLPQVEEVLVVAAECLPLNHSLRIRLTRTIVAALAKDGAVDQALQIAVKALGITVPPRLTNEQLETVQKIFAAESALIPQNSSKQQDPRQEAAASVAVRKIASNYTLNNLVGLSHLPPITSQMAAREYDVFAFFLLKMLPQTLGTDGEGYYRLLSALIRLQANSVLRNPPWASDFPFKGKLVNLSRGGVATSKDAPHKPSGKNDFDQSSNSYAKNFWHNTIVNQNLILNIFPSSNRDILMPGAERMGMSRLLECIQDWGIDTFNFDLFLQSIQAANNGYAQGSLLTRALLVEKGENSHRQKEAHRALEGDLYLRRQQGLLQAMLLQPERNTSAGRAAIREKYLLSYLDSTALQTKFYTALYGNSNSAAETGRLLYATQSGTYAFTTTAVQKRLTAKQAMVVWYPLEDKTYVAVVRADKLHWKTLPIGQAQLDGHVAAIKNNLKHASHAAEKGLTLRPFPVQDAAALYQALVAPLDKELRGINHIFSVQFGTIGGIPLGLLVSNAVDDGTPVQWLINRLAITRMPALIDVEMVEKYQVKSKRSPEILFAAGAPVVAEPPALVAESEKEDDARRITLGPVLQEIKNAPQLMENIAKTVGANTGKILAGSKMNRASVLQSLRKTSYNYVLFVTHGLVGGSTIGEPALYLAPPSDDNLDDDGLLRASEVVGLNLDTDLALLTACQTSVAGDDGSEPLAGLASAFLVAGARRVLASHWQVDATAAESITNGTISEIYKKKTDPATALQQIMKKMSSKRDLDSLEGHPYYWAAFEIIGFPSQKKK